MRLTSLPRLLAGLTAGVALALTTTVLAQDVSYNAMPGTSFAKIKTYKWVAIKSATAPDQITDTMIKNAIDAELTKKGLAKTESDDADLYIGYQAAVDHSTEWTAFNSGGVGYGYGFGGGMTTMTQDTIATGTLNLDMYDRAAKELVWRGRASKTLDPKASPEKRQNNITKAVAKMLKNYPPPVKK
jgi:hypothetical protein